MTAAPSSPPGSIRLRELLANPNPVQQRPAWADADNYAQIRFGPVVAAQIRWTVNSETGAVIGLLSDGLDSLLLRFEEEEEPGTAQMLVRVQCPADPGCNRAYDQVRTVEDLLAVLDRGFADDPFCQVEEHNEDPVDDADSAWSAAPTPWPQVANLDSNQNGTSAY